MSNTNAPFLPKETPSQSVIDCSGFLSTQQLNKLNEQGQNASFVPKIVILPRRFSPRRDLPRFTYDLNQRWHMPGNGLLMVVDLRGHKVRIIAGSELQHAGLSDNKVLQLIDTKFVAAMKQIKSRAGVPTGLENAVSNMMQGINETLPASWAKVAAKTAPPVTQIQQASALYPKSPLNNTWSTPLLIALIAAIIVGVVYAQIRSQSKKP